MTICYVHVVIQLFEEKDVIRKSDNMSLQKSKPKNQSLITFMCPASKQSEPDFFEEHQFMTNWDIIEEDGWKLPATAEPHCWCGIWKTEGCLHEDDHERLGYGKRVYVKQFQRSCYRAVCKTCYKKWIARQANQATRRIEKYSEQSEKKPIHVLLSVPSMQYHLSVKNMRKKVNEILKEINLVGAAVVFHPFRFNKKLRLFYYAPHFHVVGFGYLKGRIAEAFGKYGWFIKYLDVRKSVFQTFFYLLSHCGIKKGFHALTWIGDLSYSKLKLEKEPDLSKCPVCGRKFIEIYHDGVHPVVQPERIFEGLVDSGDWYPVFTDPSPKISEYRFDFAPAIDLNETLKGLAMAN